MNVEYIWLTLPKSIQFKVSPAVTYDFNQLIYAVCSRPADVDPFPASPRGFLALPYSVKKTFPAHLCFMEEDDLSALLVTRIKLPVGELLILKF